MFAGTFPDSHFGEVVIEIVASDVDGIQVVSLFVMCRVFGSQ